MCMKALHMYIPWVNFIICMWCIWECRCVTEYVWRSEDSLLKVAELRLQVFLPVSHPTNHGEILFWDRVQCSSWGLLKFAVTEDNLELILYSTYELTCYHHCVLCFSMACINNKIPSLKEWEWILSCSLFPFSAFFKIYSLAWFLAAWFSLIASCEESTWAR